jgi:phosphoglycolate phosphatase
MTAVPLADAAVQLVVFDLMGTLIADDAIVSDAYDAALQQAGMAVGTQRFVTAQSRIVQLRGRPTLVVLTDVLGDPVVAEEATWAFDDSILAAVPGLQPIEGAHEILASLDADGVLTAVTTSFTPEVRKAVLVHMGWTDSFAATMSAHGTRRGHPAPDLLLGAILELRIDSVAQVAIVGDSASDLEAGNRAGAGLVIGVRSGDASEASLLEAPHTHLIDSVAELRSVLSSPRTRGARRSSDH